MSFKNDLEKIRHLDTFIEVELTCKLCNYTFRIDVDNEMYDNNYCVICLNCDIEQRLMDYDYYPL